MTRVSSLATSIAIAIAALAGCAELPPETARDQRIAGERLRLMAGNLTSGTSPSYDHGAGIRIFQAMQPDVALVQEVKYAAGSRAFVDAAFGTDYEYTQGVGSIPNAVVSRYPIIAGGEWDDPQVSDRGFTWARIDVPGDIDLWAVSVHLLTKSSSARDAEARSLVAQIRAAVPADAWLVIGGDFNTDSRTEAALRTFASVVETTGPYPVDRNNDGDTNASRGKPYDWVLVSDELAARERPVEVGNSSFANGLVVDTRVYAPITELAPARAADSGAPNMQHMGVVRDFDLPETAEPNPRVEVAAPNGGERWTIGSTQTIAWSATDVATVDVAYAADGVTFAPVATNLAASAGAVAWTVIGPATTTGRIRIVATDGSATDLGDATFTTVEPVEPPSGGGVIVNEILSNEPGTATSGELVELVNTSSSAVDLGGWTLADAIAIRHRFAAGTVLAAGARLVVTGGTASTGTLGLSNSGDVVTLADGAGTAIDAATFGSAPDGVSFNRSPDATLGPLVLHTTLSSQPSSPGGAP